MLLSPCHFPPKLKGLQTFQSFLIWKVLQPLIILPFPDVIALQYPFLDRATQKTTSPNANALQVHIRTGAGLKPHKSPPHYL